MSELVHGGIATATKRFSFFHYFTREGRLMRKFIKLKNLGSRSTPAVIVAGDSRPIEVTESPQEPGGPWSLYDGRCVLTSDILTLDSARELI